MDALASQPIPIVCHIVPPFRDHDILYYGVAINYALLDRRLLRRAVSRAIATACFWGRPVSRISRIFCPIALRLEPFFNGIFASFRLHLTQSGLSTLTGEDIGRRNRRSLICARERPARQCIHTAAAAVQIAAAEEVVGRALHLSR